jgi:hypothetical protein
VGGQIYTRFPNEPASSQVCGLNRIYLATAKFDGVLFEITPFGNPHRLQKYERINIDAKTFERYQNLDANNIQSPSIIYYQVFQ